MESATLTDAFAVRMDSTETVLWVWTSGYANKSDVANAVLQLPDSRDLIISGYRSVGGVYQRSLTKIGLATGTEIWTATWASDSDSSHHSAWEMIDYTADNNSVLLAGVTAAASNTEFNFKSYGNVINGNAIVQQLPVSALTASTAPVVSAVAWTWTNSTYFTAKAARSNTDGSVVTLLVAEIEKCSVVKLTSAGAVVWGPK